MDELLMRSIGIRYLNPQSYRVILFYVVVLHVYGFIVMLWQHELSYSSYIDWLSEHWQNRLETTHIVNKYITYTTNATNNI